MKHCVSKQSSRKCHVTLPCDFNPDGEQDIYCGNHACVQAFTLACEFMYTGAIEALEDAEVAVNVWMVGVSLAIHGLATYCHTRCACIYTLYILTP